MLKKKNTILVLIVCGFLSLATISFAGEKPKTQNPKILFYGKVVDQYYKAVADANVHLDIFHTDTDNKKAAQGIIAKTNENGLFTIRDQGHSIYIKNIQRNGYDFLNQKNPDRSFEYSMVYQNAVFSPDKNAPIIFHMAKHKDEPAYLIKTPSLKRNFLPVNSPEFALNLGGTWIDGDGQFQTSAGHTDVKVKCSLSEDKKQYRLHFVSADTNSGLIATDELLEYAPADDYKSKIVLDINIPQSYEEKKTYIYVKARGGQMYSRLDINFTVRPSNLLVNLDILTNPAYSRNLKYDEEFQKYATNKRYEAREQFYQEKLIADKRKQQFSYKSRNKPTAGTENLTAKKTKTRPTDPRSYYYSP